MPTKSERAADLLNTFAGYAAYKTSAWQSHFENCDKFYAGFHDARTWIGTDKSRSDMKLHVTSEMVETLYSSLLYTLFFSGGEHFFDVLSSNVENARQLTQRLRFILYAPLDASGRTSFWSFENMLRTLLRYGVAFNSITYDHNLNRPIFSPVSPYDLYWSANTREWIDTSPYLFQFTRVPYMFLEGLRGANSGYTIPPTKTLKELANSGQTLDPMWDSKQTSSILMTGTEVGSKGGDDGVFVDLLRVTTHQKIMWLLPLPSKEGEIIYDSTNRLQAQPYCSGTYRPLLGCFGGLSPVNLLSSEHDLQQRLTNAILDAVDLAITPPRKKGPGNAEEKPWEPGALIEVMSQNLDDIMTPPQLPQEAWASYVESRARALRVVGTSEMDISGMPTPSNANRTRGGMEMQAAAREERQFGPIREIENSLVRPSLFKASLLDAAYSPQSSAIVGWSERDEEVAVDSKVLASRMHVEVRGATRMVGAARLMSVIRLILQYAISPQIMSEMAKVGYAFDVLELDQLINDAVGTQRRYRLYRKMSQQETQMHQQQRMQETQMQQQTQQQVQGEHDRVKAEIERLKQEGLSEERANQLLLELMKPRGQAS